MKSRSLTSFAAWWQRFGLATASAAVPIVTGVIRIVTGELVSGAGSVAAGVAAIIAAMLKNEQQAKIDEALAARGWRVPREDTYTAVRWLFGAVWCAWAIIFLSTFYWNIEMTAIVILSVLILILLAVVALGWRSSEQSAIANGEEPTFEDTDSDKSPLKKKALLVGINAYPGNALNGCVNDILDSIPVVVKAFGGTIQAINEQTTRLRGEGYEIAILLDKKATASNIKKGLKWLYAGVRPGDVRLFQYSGHGTQIPCTTEADGLDECLCPVDFDFRKPQTQLIDDFLYSLETAVTAGANCPVFLDSCHSGSGLRDITTNNRFMPSPHSSPTKRVVRSVSRPFAAETPHDSFVLLAGCKSDQTCADSRFVGNDGKLRANGAFTFFWLGALAALAGKHVTLSEVFSVIQETMAKTAYTQQPQLEGSPRLMQTPFLQP